MASSMELRQLTTFEAVVRHRTVTEAAAALDLAPSTVSEHIRALERSLGVPVFVRTARGMRLTAAGETLTGWARRLLDQAEQARREVADARHVLRLGALETIAASHAPSVLTRIAARDPGLAVDVRPSRSRDELMADVVGGELDAALVLDTGEALGGLGFAPPADALSFADVEPVPLALVAAPGHPLRDAAVLTVEDLRRRGERLLTNVPNCSFLLAADRLLGPALTRVRAEGVPVMRAWAEQGVGIALLPEFAVTQSLRTGTLIRLALPAPPLQLRLVWRRGEEVRADVRGMLYAVAASALGNGA
ncbi:LysR family transcriptional regulator [Streptodolium elevatio]|uniref:LysR family transcriptional regulator n=1 Tax=Streptodolium elevatio TaxID=3157996 RepID=A0ABV3DEP4_9ACTN